MQFVVTHLTRMREGICTAGPEITSGAMLRPIVKFGSLPGMLVASAGGPLRVGAVLDIGTVAPCPTPPHVEDVETAPSSWAAVGRLSDASLVEHLSEAAQAGPHTAFGDELREVGHGKHAMPRGGGQSSLTYVRPMLGAELVTDESGRLQVTFVADGRRFRLSVTDVRLYRNDLKTPDTNAFHRLRSLLQRGGDVVVGLGVGRAWGRPGEPEMHWLQANNVYPLERVCWDEGLPRAVDMGPSRLAGFTPRSRSRVSRVARQARPAAVSRRSGAASSAARQGGVFALRPFGPAQGERFPGPNG